MKTVPVEIIANDQLLQLKDIHLPAPPGIWPPAPGWWLLGLLSIAGLYLSVRYLLGKFRHYRWRKHIMAEFSALEKNQTQMTNTEFATVLSALLRRLALTLFPEQDIASLSGQEWLDFLQQHANRSDFDAELVQLLITLPYRKPDSAQAEIDRQSLLNMAEQWADLNTRLYRFPARTNGARYAS